MNLKLFAFMFLALFVLVKSKTSNSTVKPLLLKLKTNYSNPIYACDEEFMETVCKCIDTELNCYLLQLPHLHLKIIKENFVAKNAKFQECGLTVLRKDQILPGRESTIENLNFFFNNISYIENGTFDAFTCLKELNLANNNLTTIHQGILTEKLGSTLLDLKLDFNKISGLTSGTFKNMKKLQILNLSKYSGINKSIFSPYLSNLKTLHLGFCNITNLDDDFFVNLVNLKELLLYHNPLTTVPKAVNYIKNLQDLDLSWTNIAVLDKHSFGYNDKLEHLYLTGSSKLNVIKDCAFCNFPNLKKLEIWFSKNLTIFDENAFGSISSGVLYSKLTDFGISGSNVSTISEKLFDWSKADKLYLGTNGYSCDCSMAWLINDPQSFGSKLKNLRIPGHSTRGLSPPEFKNKSFTEVLGNVCGGKLSTLYHSSSPSSKLFNFHWIFLALIICGIAILCYFYHKQIIKFVYYRNIPQEENDENKLFQYFNLGEESASVSVF